MFWRDHGRDQRVSCIMADGKIQIRGGKLLAANGKLTRVDSCCCEDLGPPQCGCDHSIPAGPLTVDVSSVTIVPPGGCTGISCTPSQTELSVYLFLVECFYEFSPVGCVGGYDVLSILVNYSSGHWLVLMTFECTLGGATEVATWTGGTDPCDPTGTYTATTNCTGNLTVGVP